MKIKEIKEMFENSPVKWLAMSGMRLEEIEERHIKLVMPLGDLHKNHVGIAYAGSMFAVMELAGALLFQSTYGIHKYVPVLKKFEINYLRPTDQDLIVELSLSEEEAREKIIPIEEKGRGDYFLEVLLKDAAEKEVAKAYINYYIVPFTKEFIRSKKGGKDD